MGVWSPEFGLFDSAKKENQALEQLLDGLMTMSKVITVNELHLILTERYERLYGIRDHVVEDPENYYALVAFNAAEDYTTNDPLHEIEKRFISERIHHHTGLTLETFLNLPRHRIERVFKHCSKINEKEGEAIEAIKAAGKKPQNAPRTTRYHMGPSKGAYKPNRNQKR